MRIVLSQSVSIALVSARLAYVIDCSSCVRTNPIPCDEASPHSSVCLVASKYCSTGAVVTASLIFLKA